MNQKQLQIEIKMFGEFDILVNKESVFNKFTRLPVIIELLQYLLANYNQELSPSSLAEDIWPDKDYQDVNKVLRTYIYRLKQFLYGSNSLDLDISPYLMVTSQRGKYKLLVSEQCKLDIRTFDTEMKNMDYSLKSNESIQRIKQIVAIYNGDFLKNTVYTHWVIPFRNRYLDNFNLLANAIVSAYCTNRNYKEAIKYCEQVFEIYELDDGLNIYFLKALMMEGRVSDALQHYSYITSKMYSELQVKPSNELKEVYNLLKAPPVPSTPETKIEKNPPLSIHSVQSLFINKIPRNFKKYKLTETKNLAIGYVCIKETDDVKISEAEILQVYQKIKDFLDIILVKDYHFSFTGQKVLILLIRDCKKEFVSLITEQFKKFVTANIIPHVKVEFKMSLIEPQTKNVALLNKERVRI